MKKKHISIIGSCISRHMFNTSILEETFIVDKYAYQVCAYDFFKQPFNIDKFRCDTHLDKDLKVESLYFAKVKLKI